MERHNDSPSLSARLHSASRDGGTEHLLLRIPTLIAAALGLAFGLTRVILLIRENLKAEPSSWTATLFLGVMIGGVAVLITLFSTAVGYCVGAALQVGHHFWWAKRISTK
ncbi:MAG: hypothetical protein U0Q18_34300 [Bryobacteraceae bacterium]